MDNPPRKPPSPKKPPKPTKPSRPTSPAVSAPTESFPDIPEFPDDNYSTSAPQKSYFGPGSNSPTASTQTNPAMSVERKKTISPRGSGDGAQNYSFSPPRSTDSSPNPASDSSQDLSPHSASEAATPSPPNTDNAPVPSPPESPQDPRGRTPTAVSRESPSTSVRRAYRRSTPVSGFHVLPLSPPTSPRRATDRSQNTATVGGGSSYKATSFSARAGSPKGSWIGTKPRRETPNRAPAHSPPLSRTNHSPPSPLRTVSHSPPPCSRDPLFPGHSPPPTSHSPPPSSPPISPLPPSSIRTTSPREGGSLLNYPEKGGDLASHQSFPPPSKGDDDERGSSPTRSKLRTTVGPTKPKKSVAQSSLQSSLPHNKSSSGSEALTQNRSPLSETNRSMTMHSGMGGCVSDSDTPLPKRGGKSLRLQSRPSAPVISSVTIVPSTSSPSPPNITMPTKSMSPSISPNRVSSPTFNMPVKKRVVEKAQGWVDLSSTHHARIKGYFEDLMAMKIVDLSKPVMAEADYKVVGDQQQDRDAETQALFDARTVLNEFQDDLTEVFDRLFDILGFLPVPWDEGTLSEIFHYKWLLVSFTTPADLFHLGLLAAAYEESAKTAHRAERERLKRKEIIPRGIFKRFGKGREKTKQTSENVVEQFDLKTVEKSLSTREVLFLRTMVNVGKFCEKYRMDPNSVIVGSQPCETLLGDLSHLPLLSSMTREQEKFYQKKRAEEEEANRLETSLIATQTRERKKGKGKDSIPVPVDPAKKKKKVLVDEEVEIEIPNDVPITCLNTNSGAFPDRVQLIRRFVLWGRRLEEDPDRDDVAEELATLETILEAEMWVEQVWREGGGLLIPGEVLIGIIPNAEIRRVEEETNERKEGLLPPPSDEPPPEPEGRMSMIDAIIKPAPLSPPITINPLVNPDDPWEQSLASLPPALLRMQSISSKIHSNPLMFCRFVGAKRHGLLVEIGAYSEPIYLTWQQAVPLPDTWKKYIKRGEVSDVARLLADDRLGGRYKTSSRAIKDKKHLMKKSRANNKGNNKLGLEPSVLSLSAAVLTGKKEGKKG